jgi:hypothetical protein
MRIGSIGMLLTVAFAAAPLSAQTTRWNATGNPEDAIDEVPRVRVWLDGPTMVPRGGAVRVRFQVEEDAHVVIARVDWSGRLTLLHPAARNRSAFVRAGTEHRINGARMGAFGSFYASEQPGMSGYVFAISSFEPFDLSQLHHSDFSRYVTGASVRSASRYLGDPYRVVTRFADATLGNAPFEYDVAFYSVDHPTYSSIAGFSAHCRSRQYDGFATGYSAWVNGDFESDLCSGLSRYASCFGSLGWFSGSPFGCYRRPIYVTQGPSQPPPSGPKDGPGFDTTRVNPWAPDSIRAPNVDRLPPSDREKIPVDKDRPGRAAVGDDRDDRSFSIPPRALRNVRRDQAGNPREATSPMPARSAAELANGQPTEWMRPPRDIDRAEEGREPPRRDRREPTTRDRGQGGGQDRDFVSTRDREPTYNPPPRSRPERSSNGNSGAGRSSGERTGTSAPAPRTSRPIESSAGGGGGGGRASSPPPAPRAEPARQPSPSTERKPESRQPESRQPDRKPN